MATGVLFVCLGNICRSPMAEGILRKEVADRGMSERFDIDSCGTGSWHVGGPMSEGTARVLRSRNAWYEHEARQIREADFERFDHVLTMDDSNLRTLRQRYPHLAERPRPVLDPVGGGSVPDPYGGGGEEFERVWRALHPAVLAWLDQWS